VIQKVLQMGLLMVQMTGHSMEHYLVLHLVIYLECHLVLQMETPRHPDLEQYSSNLLEIRMEHYLVRQREPSMELQME